MEQLKPSIKSAKQSNTFLGALIKHFYILLILLFPVELVAQPVISSVTGTTSRCIRNGSLTVSVTGGAGSLQYSLITPSVELRPNQVSNVFAALAPGKYTILVVDVNSQRDTATFTITGNYKVPTYTYSARQTTCSKANGAFNVNRVTGGRAPYKYKIINGPSTTGWQTSNAFTGMAKGTYTVAISDSCGNTKNLSVTVKDSFRYGLQGRGDNFRRVSGNCDSFEMRFFAAYGFGSLEYRIIDGTDTFKFSKTQYVRLKLGKNYKYEVVDACGVVISSDIKYAKVLYTSLIFTNCNQMQIDIEPFYYKFNANSGCYKFGLINKKTNVAIWQNSKRFTVYPNITYDLYAIDTCCKDTFFVQRSFSRNRRLFSQKILPTNLDSTTGIRILNYSTNYPYYTIFLKTPFTSSDSFVTTPDQDVQGKYPYNFKAGDTLGFYMTYISDLFNAPKGKYTFMVVDTCGYSDTIDVEVLESDLWKKELKYTVIAGCPSGHSIAYSIANSVNTEPNVKFFQLSPKTSKKNISYKIKNPIMYDTLKSLTAGTYLILITNRFGGPYMTGSRMFETISDTIVVKDPGFPLLEPPITYTCRNGSSSILAKANGGLRPYAFRIIKAGSNTWSKPQKTGEFHNLTTGTYRIEVTDTCGNSNVISASSGFLTAPKLKLGFSCDADTLRLFGNKIYGVKYRWFKGTTQISTALSHSFKPYTTSDYGTYKLQAYINNSNGVCVDTSASITIGSNIEVRSNDLYACDSFKHKNKWITKTSFFKDTLQSVGGCDSVAITKVYIGHTVLQTIDTVNCDSSFVFGDWYYHSQIVYDTIIGRGYLLDSLAFANFETSPSGWVFNNSSMTNGNARSGTRKLEFNSPNDWVDIPSVNYPNQLHYDYQLSSLNYGGNKIKVQYHNGSIWVDIKEKDLTSSIYEKHSIDLSAVQNKANVRLRLRQSSPATNAISYIDNVLVTNTTVECDTIIKVNLSVNKSIEKDEYKTECDSALVYGEWFYSTQKIKDTLATYLGCDSLITTHLTINSAKITPVNTTVCDSGSVNGTMYYTTQLVKDSFTTYLNCDSLVHTNLIVNKVKRTYQSQTDCDSGLVHSKWYYTTQMVNDTFTTTLNCDSIVITDLIVNHTKITPISITNCDSSLIHGTWYFRTQEVRDSFSSYLNCDSVVVTNLTINPTVITKVNITNCDSALIHGTWYFRSQKVRDTFATYLNCDSVVVTDLVINYTQITNVYTEVCDSGMVNGTMYYVTQLVKDNFTTYLNCDSLVHTDFIVKKVKLVYESQIVCDSALIHGTWYFSTQEVRDSFSSYLNCDSIVITDLIVNYTKMTPISITNCDSSLIHGTWYFRTQEVRDTFSSYLNCDSVVVTNLTINPTVITKVNMTVCDSGMVQGKWYYTSQIIQDILSTSLNCDSIIITDLTINYTQVTRQNITSCDSAMLNGTWYFSTQEVRDSFSSFLNCDSVVITHLVINPTQETRRKVSICDSIIINNNWYFTSQKVIDNLKTYHGCDSIVITDLEVRKSFFNAFADTFCRFYDYKLNDGRIVSQPGIYQSIYSTIQNCDSIIEVNLVEKNCSPCTVFFPNAFTPNLDNLNEGFKREGTCTFKKYQLTIFSRWGEKLFYTENPDSKWDGVYKNSIVQEGVYVFTCYYITNEGKIKHVYGNITLLR